MVKGYITESDVSGMGEDAEVVAVMEASAKFKEVSGWTLGKNYCSNCKKGIHSTPNKSRCKNAKNCECRCRTHYIGKDGLLRPYGVIDDSDEREAKLAQKYNPETDKLIADINLKMKKQSEKSNVRVSKQK